MKTTQNSIAPSQNFYCILFHNFPKVMGLVEKIILAENTVVSVSQNIQAKIIKQDFMSALSNHRLNQVLFINLLFAWYLNSNIFVWNHNLRNI